MHSFNIGDVVVRKSYGGDTLFRISRSDTRDDGRKVFALKGLLYRIEADADEDDLLPRSKRSAYYEVQRNLTAMSQQSRSAIPSFLQSRFPRQRTPGMILHIDSSEEFMNMCLKYYKQMNIKAIGKVIEESRQPEYVRPLLESTGADIIIITGHDGYKKNTSKIDNVNNYRNSKYYMQSAREARKFQPDFDKLCIFSGACQSYYEGIMEAGANFASSPGRVFIHALDPGKVGKSVALTDTSRLVTAEQIADITQSGMEGIGGIATKGHLK